MKKNIINYYNKNDDREWGRLFSDKYHQIEYLVTWHFLSKYLPKSGHILDAGGGPGRYSIELAKRKYQVTLCDTAQNLLDIADKKVTELGLKNRLQGINQLSITDLGIYKDGQFDSVLCLGAPLSHLTRELDRQKAISELRRVTKPGGCIFLGVLSKFGAFPRHVIKSAPDQLDKLNAYLKHGNRLIKKQDEGFTEAHYFSVEELTSLCKEHKLKIQETATLEGLATGLSTQVNSLDEKQFKNLVKFLIKTSTEQTITNMSEHWLMIVKK